MGKKNENTNCDKRNNNRIDDNNDNDNGKTGNENSNNNDNIKNDKNENEIDNNNRTDTDNMLDDAFEMKKKKKRESSGNITELNLPNPLTSTKKILKQNSENIPWNITGNIPGDTFSQNMFDGSLGAVDCNSCTNFFP